MSGEAVLDHRVQDAARAIQIELDAVDVLDELARQCESHELRVPEEFGSVGGEGQRRLERRDEAEVDDLQAAPCDEEVGRLHILVPKAFVVEAPKLVAEVSAVRDDALEVSVGEAVRSAHRVHAARDLVEAFTGDEGHDVVERAFAEFVLEDEAKVLGGFQGPALADDLRDRGAVLKVEGFDHDALGDREASLGHLLGALIRGDRAKQTCARAARLQLFLDLVALERRRPRCLCTTGEGGWTAREAAGPGLAIHDVGDPTLDALGQCAKTEQSNRVPKPDAVEARQRAGEFVLDSAEVVASCLPAQEAKAGQAEREDEAKGDDTPSELGCVANLSDHEACHVSNETSGQPEDASQGEPEAPKDLDERPDGEHGDGQDDDRAEGEGEES